MWKVQVTEKIKEKITFQSYKADKWIEGVKLVHTIVHNQLEGSFVELAKFKSGFSSEFSDFELAQLSLTVAVPHRVNAFHVHPVKGQAEIWIVVSGIMKVCLVDLRSEGNLEMQNLILSGANPALLYIPPGVAHGYKSGHQGAIMLYASNQHFDKENPDEGRLPWDLFGAEIWGEDKG